MEHAKKYALIPENDLNKHVPTKRDLSDFDKDMQKILSSNLNDFEKVKLYYELLKRKANLLEFNHPYLSVNNGEEEIKKIKDEPASERTPVTDFDEMVLRSVPSTIKQYASQLLQYLKTSPDIIKWNQRGEIIYKNNLIANSNIADLCTLILSQRKSLNNIIGKTEFLRALNEANVPRLFIRNNHLFRDNNNLFQDNEVSPSVKRRKSSPYNVKWEKFE